MVVVVVGVVVVLVVGVVVVVGVLVVSAGVVAVVVGGVVFGAVVVSVGVAVVVGAAVVEGVALVTVGDVDDGPLEGAAGPVGTAVEGPVELVPAAGWSPGMSWVFRIPSYCVIAAVTAASI